MTDKPLTTDPEQQHADNVASRRQSGLDPVPDEGEARDESRETQENGSKQDAERKAGR